MEAGDMVSKIASLGAGGHHKSNIERDFHTLLKSFSRRLGAKLSTVRARTGMFFFHVWGNRNPKKTCFRRDSMMFFFETVGTKGPPSSIWDDVYKPFHAGCMTTRTPELNGKMCQYFSLMILPLHSTTVGNIVFNIVCWAMLMLQSIGTIAPAMVHGSAPIP